MNEYDSNRIFDLTKKIGYSPTLDIDDSNCIIINTCHIREKATDKIYHEVGRLKKRFVNKRKPIIIVSGCVAQAEGDIMIEKESFIDAVVGPQSYHKINKIIENIDIGGPSMVRAAAKNSKDVTIITDKKDYLKLIKELNKFKGRTSFNFRKKMASKAFGLTAYYDAVVSEWFNRDIGIEFPERKTFFGKKISQLRYGENPHQKSSIYINSLKNDDINLKHINGKELSYNNYNDIFSSLDILFSNLNSPSTVIIKHANPCGVSSNKSAFQSFLNAQASDPISAFGGIVACNYKINNKIAQEITKTFFEVILAKGFDNKALRILKKKKNMRLIDISNFSYESKTSGKFFDNAFLLQERDNIVFNKKKLRCMTKNKPSSKELKDIEFAFKVCKYVKSNAIVIVKDNSTIGIGAG